MLFRVATRDKIDKTAVLPVFCGIERHFGNSCTQRWYGRHCVIFVLCTKFIVEALLFQIEATTY